MTCSAFAYYVRRLKTARITDAYWRSAKWLRYWRQKRLSRQDPETYSVERLCEHPENWLRLNHLTDLRPEINESLLSTLSQGWWTEDTYWKEFSRLYPAEVDTILKRAEACCKGEFLLFQWRTFGSSSTLPWSSTFDQSHPTEDWPKIHFSEINYSFDPSRPGRDVKWCWELNRFQHLLWLGAAWRITGDERFADGARAQLDDWMQAVRYPVGVQWSSNLEVGLRALSWARCHILCLNSKSWNEDFTARFLACLYIHCGHINRELSLDHARTNHLLGETAALAHLSILYRPFRESEKWLKRSLRILGKLVPELIRADGVYAEQTTGYFRFISEFLLPLVDAAAVNDVPFPKILHSRLSAGLRFVKSLGPWGDDIPMIGDADSGTAIGWQISDYWDFSALFASAAVLLGEPWLLEGMKQYPAESYLFLGGKGKVCLDNYVRSQTLADRSETGAACRRRILINFPAGGYQVSADNTFHLVFDGGPLGISPGFGHGHADGLSFVLYCNGAPVIIDPGTFQYNGPVIWREYFRSTRAHNTISIDGQSQSKMLDTFRWCKPLNISLDPTLGNNDWNLLCGRITWPSAVHHRYVMHIFDHGIMIIDHVEGKDRHSLEWRLNFAHQWDLAQLDETKYVASSPEDKLALQLIQPEGSQAAILYGSEAPIGGWYSRLYGLKKPCFCLRSVATTDLPSIYILRITREGEELIIPQDMPLDKFPKEISKIMRLV